MMWLYLGQRIGLDAILHPDASVNASNRSDTPLSFTQSMLDEELRKLEDKSEDEKTRNKRIKKIYRLRNIAKILKQYGAHL